MSLTTAIAVYFIIWWVVLFAVLPWGVKSQAEEGRVSEGTEAGAPARPLILRKLLATTLISALVFAILWYLRVKVGLGLEDLPDIGPKPSY
jgi:predicted secreted protein